MDDVLSKRMKPAIGILALSCVLLGLGCRPTSDPEVVARVGSREIRVSDVKSEVARLSRQGSRVPDREQVLERLIDRELLLARARALGLDQEPGIRRAMDNVLIGHLRERELENRIQDAAPPGPEAGETESGSVSESTPRKERHVAVLQMAIPEKASTETRRRLEQRIGEARRMAVSDAAVSPDFGELAVRFSEEPGSRYRGGDIGWISMEAPRSRWSPDLLTAAFALRQPGDISDVIESGRHLYVVKLMGERTVADRHDPGSGMARRNRDQQQRRQELESSFMETVRASAKVVRFPGMLHAVEIPSDASLADSAAMPPRLP